MSENVTTGGKITLCQQVTILAVMTFVLGLAIGYASGGGDGSLSNFLEKADKLLAPLHKLATMAAALVAIGVASVALIAVREWRADIKRELQESLGVKPAQQR